MTLASTAGTERTAGDIIRRAMQLAGLLYTSHSPDTNDEALALVLLDTIIADLANNGITVRRQELRAYTVLAGEGELTLDDDVARVVGHGTYNLVGGTNEVQLTQMSLQQWAVVSDKSSTGTPTRFFVSGSHPATVYLYPIPTSDVVLNVAVATEAHDTNSSNVSIDLEPNWYQFLLWELAYQMSTAKDVEMNKVVLLGKQAAEKRTYAVRHAKSQLGTRMTLVHTTSWS